MATPQHILCCPEANVPQIGVIVHLENQFVPQLQLPGWCLEMLHQDLHIIFSFPHNMIYGHDNVLSLARLILLLYTEQRLLKPNCSICVFSDLRTFILKVRYLSQNWYLTFLWQFSSSGMFLTEWPFRLCLYRTNFTVDICPIKGTFQIFFSLVWLVFLTDCRK